MSASVMPDLPQLSTEPPTEPLPRPPSPDGEPPKRQRGRPKGSVTQEAPPPGPPPVSPEDLKAAQDAMRISFKAAGILASGKWGGHWLLADAELDQLGTAWGTAVAPYLAKLGPAMPFVGAILVTGTILAPKVMQTMEDRRVAKLNPMQDATPETPAPVRADVVPIRQAEPPRGR